MDGDENSCFFHFCVFAHRRTNKTDVLEFGVHVLYNHTQKVSVLHDFYHSLLGVSRPITWKFDHATLYPNQNSHLSELDLPFCTEEYESIIRCMKKDSSPRLYRGLALAFILPLGISLRCCSTTYVQLSTLTRLTLEGFTYPSLFSCQKRTR